MLDFLVKSDADLIIIDENLKILSGSSADRAGRGILFFFNSKPSYMAYGLDFIIVVNILFRIPVGFFYVNLTGIHS